MLHFRAASRADKFHTYRLPKPDAALSSSKLDFYKYFTGTGEGFIDIATPDSSTDINVAREKTKNFKSCLTPFTLDFPIVTPHNQN